MTNGEGRSGDVVPVLAIGWLALRFESIGVDVDAILDGLPIDRAAFTDPRAQISIPVLVRMGQRLVQAMGGGAGALRAIEDVSAQLFSQPPLLRLLRAQYVGLDGLYRFLFVGLIGVRWAALAPEAVWRSGGCRVSFELPPGSEGITASLAGILRGVPQLMGFAEATVQTSREDRRVVLDVTFPRSRAQWMRPWTLIARWLRKPPPARPGVPPTPRPAVAPVAVQESPGIQRRPHSGRSKVGPASNEWIAAIAENTNDLFLVCDGSARIVFSNRAAQRVFSGELPRRWPTGLYEFVHPEDRERARRTFRAAAASDQARQTDLRLLDTGGGDVIWLEASGQRFLDGRGRVRLLITARDVSSRRSAEQRHIRQIERSRTEDQRRIRELEQAAEELRDLTERGMLAARMGAAQELAGSVAHVINNPLGALMGHLQMMLEQEGGFADRDRLQRVHTLAERIRASVEGMLRLTRAREGTLNLSLGDPGTILNEVRDEISPRCARKDVELELRIEPKLPRVFADRTMLRTALVAIAENAIDASPKEGKVVLQASAIPRLQLVEFRVEDSGPGIPEEILSQICNLFFTTRMGGTGLGLSIASGIVAGHQGRIQFLSRIGGGTVVVVQIPLRTTSERVVETEASGSDDTLQPVL